MGTVDGKIFYYHDEKLLEITLRDPLVDFIDAIYKDHSNNVWVGYRGAGIRKYRFNGSSLLMVKEYSAKTGFSDLRIRCSFADEKGNIFFGTRTNGVFIIPIHDENNVIHLSTANGLSSNWIKMITMDRSGFTYLSTNKGVNILSGDYTKPVIRKINILNDQLTDETSFVYPDDNKAWIATDQGILEYFPQKDFTVSAPLVYITEFSVDGKKDESLAPYLANVKKRLRSGNNVIGFEFTAIDMKNDEPVQYRYKLEGQDKDWVNSGERNYVSYNLPPGNYIFKASAKNPGGKWSREAAFSFFIPSPFWKTWWFYSAILLIAMAIAFLIYRYRMNQALKLERLRSRISTDLHDDIGSTLSSITILSDIAAREKDVLQSGNMMQEIKQSSVSLMEKMDDIVWSINPGNDSIENLMLRIKRFASTLFEAKEIDYAIRIDEQIYKTKLDMETRQHIYLILKEAINNLVKYSQCSQAVIEVKYAGNHLNIMVTDNGKGFNQHNIQLGNGIISMKKRADAINGEIRITTALDKGTTILLQTKIK